MAPAGLSRGGERRAGFLLAQEGHQGAYPKEPGFPLPRESLGGRSKEAWVPACAGRTPRGTPKEAWVPAFAGMTPTGFLLSQE
jgi:hypothetical protein